MSTASVASAQASIPLRYTIAQCSAHSGRYVAENIIVDNPLDQSSRWSGAHQGYEKQWVLLKLESLAVLKTITFGKYHKPHPCNVKEFQVYVGMNAEHMCEVLHSGLKNDSVPESFQIKHVNEAGICFPTRYVKIVPLSAHGQSFHTSIWHISMTGIIDEKCVDRVRTAYDEYREAAVIRHILKHLRQRRLLTPFENIISRSGLLLEHPLVTQLHQSIVLHGDWPRAEHLVCMISKAGLFDSYLHACRPQAVWKRLRGTDADGDVPSPRGGHAMCIDPTNDVIYLFGGWDGQKSLDDFWAYDIKEDRWRVLSHSTSTEQNAPGARSCHKMVFDTKTGSIYLLGRLSDSDAIKPGDEASRPSETNPGNGSSTRAFCSEFYRYHTRGLDAGKWDFLSFDTASSGGPPLVFDHQMAIDSDAQILYVFGGRVVDGDWDTVKYSGLYSYNIRLSKWKLLQHPDTSNTLQVIIPSRFGHSMVLEPTTSTLFIFAGQRDDKYLSDMYAFDLTTSTATELFSNFTTAGGPDACFTQRAVIDPELKEVYVFCGLTRGPQVGSPTTLSSESPNWVYRYESHPGTWTRILPQSNDDSEAAQPDVPASRYAHQVVYNPKTKSFFLHGGNAGISGRIERSRSDGQTDSNKKDEGIKEKRLDDFWRMNLARPGSEEVIRRAKYYIRQQQFREMCEDTTPVKALNFLQTEVSSVVNHSDPAEAETFRSLLSFLLGPTSSLSAGNGTPDEHPEKPPRKRSRSDSLEDKWTDELDELGIGDSRSLRSVNASVLRDTEDPTERETGGSKLAGARFRQRNDVFESLLEFVSERDKQPDVNLLDMVDGDEGGL